MESGEKIRWAISHSKPLYLLNMTRVYTYNLYIYIDHHHETTCTRNLDGLQLLLNNFLTIPFSSWDECRFSMVKLWKIATDYPTTWTDLFLCCCLFSKRGIINLNLSVVVVIISVCLYFGTRGQNSPHFTVQQQHKVQPPQWPYSWINVSLKRFQQKLNILNPTFRKVLHGFIRLH